VIEERGEGLELSFEVSYLGIYYSIYISYWRVMECASISKGHM
jgi:hypothetical protein